MAISLPVAGIGISEHYISYISVLYYVVESVEVVSIGLLLSELLPGTHPRIFSSRKPHTYIYFVLITATMCVAIMRALDSLINVSKAEQTSTTYRVHLESLATLSSNGIISMYTTAHSSDLDQRRHKHYRLEWRLLALR